MAQAFRISYAEGTGIPRDDREAVNWFQRAADQGDARAQFNLGNHIFNGTGVPLDLKQAIMWFQRAAEQGYSNAEFNLGVCYGDGTGVPQSHRQAFIWYQRAAEQGLANAQCNLGVYYWQGTGVPKDLISAYKWLNLAATTFSLAAEARDQVVLEMTPSQVAEAQRLSTDFVATETFKMSKVTFDGDELTVAHDIVQSTGTAFFVDSFGHAVTAAHVISGASRIEVLKDGNSFPARILHMDLVNDVAVIKVDGDFSAIPLGSSEDTHLGANVFSVGYPNVTIQGISPKYTKGEVNALAGIQDDPRFFQVSVAVQPGNSGSPLVNENGEVIGIIVMQLDQIATLESSGVLPQNVNYALKSTFVRQLLDSLPGYSPKNEPVKSSSTKSSEDNIRAAEAATVLVIAY
jgi:S1-C subfamily serine protease